MNLQPSSAPPGIITAPHLIWSTSVQRKKKWTCRKVVCLILLCLPGTTTYFPALVVSLHLFYYLFLACPVFCQLLPWGLFSLPKALFSPGIKTRSEWTALCTGKTTLRAHWDPITQTTFGGGLAHIWPHSYSSVYVSVSWSTLRNAYLTEWKYVLKVCLVSQKALRLSFGCYHAYCRWCGAVFVPVLLALISPAVWRYVAAGLGLAYS